MVNIEYGMTEEIIKHIFTQRRKCNNTDLNQKHIDINAYLAIIWN